MHLSTVAMLGVYISIAVSAMKSNMGRQFLVIFLETVKDGCQLNLYITTSSVNLIYVDISVPLRPDIGKNVSVRVNSIAPALVDISPELSANGTGMNDYGILVESSGDVTVQAYSQTLASTGLISTASFMVIPVESLGTEYMIVTYCEKDFCQFAVASTVVTAVELDLRIGSQASFTYNGESYRNGEIFTVALRAFQVFQVQTEGDLSGTIIKSSPGKIAVVVGSTYTSITPLVQPKEGDHLVEQMPPLNTWGWSYVIVAFPGRTSGDMVVFLAVEKDCLVTSSLGIHLNLTYRRPLLVRFYPGISGRLDSTGRIIMALFTQSPEMVDNNTVTSMFLVPPVEQWRTANTTIAATTPTSKTAMIYGKAACVGTLVVSGSVLPASKWTPILDTDYAFATLDLTTSGVIIESSTAKCAVLGGYIYGSSWMSAFALSIGAYFRELLPARIQPSSSTKGHVSTTSLLPAVTSSIENTVPSAEASYTTSDTMTSPVSPAPLPLLLPPPPLSIPGLTPPPNIQVLTPPPPRLPSLSSASTLSSALRLKTSTTTSSTAPSTVGARSVCGCRCHRPDRELKTGAVHIKQRLTLDTSRLSKTLRRKSSVPDESRSAVAIGTSATVFLVLSVGVVVATDAFAVIDHIIRRLM